jgi:Mrp family chromosome partitioning ATPase
MRNECAVKGPRPASPPGEAAEGEALAARLAKIRHKIFVLSGKGGVGKSTIAVNVAAALAQRGCVVGLLDADVHGPSVPRLLGLAERITMASDSSIAPARAGERLSVMSIGLLLPGPDDAVVWRGPLKMGLIRQFLEDVEWGELDYLIVDSPPGTGDEPLSLAQLVPDADGAVIVTTPQMVAVADVRRCIGFCRQVKLPVLGVVENMSGLVCPSCGAVTHVFGSGGGQRLAHDVNVPFLGRIPLDPAVVSSGDEGRPYVGRSGESASAEAMNEIVERIVALDGTRRE